MPVSFVLYVTAKASVYCRSMTDAAAAEPWTVLRLLNWTREHFARSDVPSPRLSAEVLLAHALGCRRIQLYARYDYRPTPEELTSYRDGVRRAARGEPVAYIVGEKEFYSLKFTVTPDVLVPRPESELLVELALRQLAVLDRPGRVWDACTGSGCVAVAIASQQEHARLLATDISAQAVEIARLNAERNGVAERVQCAVADMLKWPGELGAPQPVDIITANPPYVRRTDPVAACVRHEPEVALYAPDAAGLEMIRRLIAQAPEHLIPGGVLLTEFGLDQADEVRDLFMDAEDFDEPQIVRDMAGRDRVAVAERLV